VSTAVHPRPRRGALALLVACLVVLAGSTGAPAGAAPKPGTGLGIRLLEAPVALKDDPRAQSYIVDNLPPGTTITRKIQVSNATGSTQRVSLYPGAATIPSGQGFTVLDGRAGNELTSWISVTPAEATLPDGGTRDAEVRIAVPRNATEAERYAVVWAEIGGSAPAGGGIVGVSRVGIRVYLSVGPGNGPPADFRLGSLTPGRSSAGAPQLVVDVENTGQRALDPRGTVTLSDGPGGVSAAPVTASGASIGPGQRGSVVFPFDKAIAAGPWKAAVSVSSGPITRDSTGTISFPGASDTVQQSSGTPWWVWLIVGVAVAGALVLGLVLVVRRRGAPS
jgi:hypothetical protein